jgi:hypothetical protein
MAGFLCSKHGLETTAESGRQSLKAIQTMISKFTDTKPRKRLRPARGLVQYAAEKQADFSAGYEDSRDETDRALRDNLDRAKLLFECARVEFKAMMHDIPSGLPHTDGTAEMQQAGNLYRSAMKDYRRAAEEFSDFLFHDIVPYRLKECGKNVDDSSGSIN